MAKLALRALGMSTLRPRRNKRPSEFIQLVASCERKRGRQLETVAETTFDFIFVFMLVNLWSALPAFAANPWTMATLYQAYFGF